MRNRLTLWAFVLILLAIPVLGYVQWRWIERVADAEIERERQRVASALDRVAAECNAEITRAHMFFVADPHELLDRLGEWKARAPVPAIVRELFVTEPDHSMGRHPAGMWNGAPALFMPIGGGPREFRPFGRGRFMGMPHPNLPPPDLPPRVRVVVLDSKAIAESFLPRLVDRHLGSGAYAIAVRGPEGVIHGGNLQTPDASVSVLAVDPECLLPPNPGRPRRVLETDILSLPARPCTRSPEDGLWRLEVRHSAGSLVHAVRSVRTHNLTVSFGVLALLTGAVVALWLSIRRARMLAQRQVEFAMSVSHELRTPLTVMRLAGDNLASGMTVSPEQAKRYGETIRTQAERLGSMVDQVLTFARSERPDWQVRTDSLRPESIVQAALATSEGVVRESGCTLESEAETELPAIDADANLMTSAVSNLIINAARYGATGRWIRVRVFSDENAVVFEVADRGPGIAPRDLRRVFEPFYRGHNSGHSRGAGLGLHLVRRIAEAHGGRVTIESSEGAGTTVRIYLPTTQRKEETAGETASADRRG